MKRKAIRKDSFSEGSYTIFFPEQTLLLPYPHQREEVFPDLRRVQCRIRCNGEFK